MTGFVLDASTTLAWAFDDECTPDADHALSALIDGHAITPSLWPYEVANGLAVAVRRGRITPDEAAEFTNDLSALDIRVDTDAPDPLTLAAAAMETNLSAYDAAYLALSQRTGLPLVTQDSRLATAAVSAGLTLLTGSRP